MKNVTEKKLEIGNVDWNGCMSTDEPVQIKDKPIYRFIKRFFDIMLALVIGVILLIPMLVVAIMIHLESPGPVIFKQMRIGKNGEPFVIWKFRTMSVEAPSEKAARDFRNADAYITKVGAILRRTSIDELPQLVNILKGEMSFVGYRPVCVTETELNDLRKAYGVFAVRPGLTGLAQVYGRDNLGYRKKAEIDAEYVRRRNFALDLWCLLRTFSVVCSGEGVI